MCGRFELINGQRVFIRFNVSTTSPVQPRLIDNLDVRPTQQVPMLTTDNALSPMTWGIQQGGGPRRHSPARFHHCEDYLGKAS